MQCGLEYHERGICRFHDDILIFLYATLPYQFIFISYALFLIIVVQNMRRKVPKYTQSFCHPG